jgi:tetratricopeptide (TPR) repeat protein
MKRIVAVFSSVAALVLSAHSLVVRAQQSKEETDRLDKERQSAALKGHCKRMADVDTQILKIVPNSSDCYIDRANAYSHMGRVKETLADLDKYFQLTAKKPSEWYQVRAWMYCTQKLYDAAIKDCDSAIKVSPTVPRAYALRSQIYALTEPYDKAIQDILKPESLHFDAKEVNKMLAEA